MRSAIILAAIICLIIVAIGLNRASTYVIKNACSKFKKTLLSKEYDTLKSGDIILFTPSLHNFTNSLLTGCYFSHIGMVVKSENGGKGPRSDDEGLYMSETNGITAIKTTGGAAFFPLLSRLKYYDGGHFLMRLNKPLDQERKNKLLKLSKEVLDHPYPSLKTKVLSAVGLSNDNTRHCFQHVGFLLQQMNLLPPEIDLGIFSSANISTIFRYKLNNGYQYEYPVQMVYDLPDDPKLNDKNVSQMK